MVRRKDMVKIDVLMARDILSTLKISAKKLARETGKGDSFISNVLERGTISRRDIALIQKIHGVDLTPCIILEEETKPKQTEESSEEIVESSNKLCDTIRESSNSRSLQSMLNTTEITNAIDRLTDAINELHKDLNANFDGQYKQLDNLKMKIDRIRKS